MFWFDSFVDWVCDRCGEENDGTAFPANYGDDFWCETCISSRTPDYDDDELDIDD